MKKTVVASLLCAFACTLAFSAQMNQRVRSVPKDIQENIFKQPQKTLPLLVKNLVGNSQSTTEKVKILHDWICDNIAYDTAIFSGSAGKQDYVSVLKKRKAVCSGYTNLMCEMCSLADVEAIGISGYSKGFGYRGFIEDGQQPDHDWNAIKLGNKWQLVDVTWDAGFVDSKTFVKHYSTDYLYLTPEQFTYSHLPEDSSFQYLKEPKTREQFVREPYIPGKFFVLGLALGKNAPDYTNSITSSIRYDFKLTKTNVSVMSDVLSKNDRAFVENASWIDRAGATVSATFDVPDTKPYKARVLARQKTAEIIPVFFSIMEFEEILLPEAQQLLLQKKITQTELEHFEKSYFKVEENGRYYHAEDLFATTRNAAVLKILRLEKQTNSYDEVISFTVQTADGYTGFGGTELRFPTAYAAYHEAQNTHLVSPESGTLKKGETYTFSVRTSDFTAVGIVLNGNIIPLKKNPTSGAAELVFTVPDNCDEVPVFASKNGRNYSGLYVYAVE